MLLYRKFFITSLSSESLILLRIRLSSSASDMKRPKRLLLSYNLARCYIWSPVREVIFSWGVIKEHHTSPIFGKMTGFLDLHFFLCQSVQHFLQMRTCFREFRIYGLRLSRIYKTLKKDREKINVYSKKYKYFHFAYRNQQKIKKDIQRVPDLNQTRL